MLKQSIKKMVVALLLALSVPFATHAQSDGFFSNYSNGENRDGGISSGATVSEMGQSTPSGEPAPLTGGLAILMAAGAGYVVLKKKNNK